MPSTRRSKKRPEERPTFLVDRTFGHAVAETLRDLGYTTYTLADVYGSQGAERVKDPRWIRRSANEGWIGVTRDDLRPWRGVIVEARARIFRIGRAAKNTDLQTRWIMININRMVQRARKQGPWMYVVREKTLESVTLPVGRRKSRSGR